MHDVVRMTDTVADICRRTLNMPMLGKDDDFFDRGASSLTIVELQIQVENALGIKVPTSALMLESSIAGWIGVYHTATLAS